MQAPDDTPTQSGLDQRAKITIGLCAVLPVVIGVLLTLSTFKDKPPPPPPVPGHWVYVSGSSVAVHVDGATKRVDSTIDVGSADTGSPVLQDRQFAYLVDGDHVTVFNRTGGVANHLPSAGVAEEPMPIESGGNAYAVYRSAGMVMRLGSQQQQPIQAGEPLSMPVVTQDGALWVYKTNSGEICVLSGNDPLRCPAHAPVSHDGALTMAGGKPVFVDITASTWMPLSNDGAGTATPLRTSLPANAIVGASDLSGRLPVIDQNAGKLIMVSAQGDSRVVPLPQGHYERPMTTAGAVAVVNDDTGVVTSFDTNGRELSRQTVGGGSVRLSGGDDGRVYADSADGQRSVVMDGDGALTMVPTGKDGPISFEQPTSTPAPTSPPAPAIALTTTETIPPAPDTVTIETTPSTSGANGAGGTGGTAGGGGGGAGGDGKTKSKRPSTTRKPPGPPPGSAVIDVLSATSTGPGQATVRFSVHGDAPIFCHVYFNSVERTATNCAGTMQVVVTGLDPNTAYDVYVFGNNAKGTGPLGRRAEMHT